MNALLPLIYLPNIQYYKILLESENVLLDKFENYQKQTFRNRAVIYGANGTLTINIPIKNSRKRQINSKQINYNTEWQNNHWKSLMSAYRSSAYFEYYESNFIDFYNYNYLNLVDLTLNIIIKINELIGIKNSNISFTDNYYSSIDNFVDFRNHFNKDSKPIISNVDYFQVFENKYGKIQNLSILDLLFNEGPNSINIIKELKLYY